MSIWACIIHKLFSSVSAVKSGNRQDSGKYVLGSWGGERSGSPAVHSACQIKKRWDLRSLRSPYLWAHWLLVHASVHPLLHLTRFCLLNGMGWHSLSSQIWLLCGGSDYCLFHSPIYNSHFKWNCPNSEKVEVKPGRKW